MVPRIWKVAGWISQESEPAIAQQREELTSDSRTRQGGLASLGGPGCDLGRLPTLSGPQFLTWKVGAMMVKVSSEVLSFLLLPLCSGFAETF